jgi:hypothetical protein
MRTSHDHRLTWALITDLLDVLDKHRFHSACHTGPTFGVAGDLARIYEDPQDPPAGSGLHPQPPGASTALADYPANSDGVTIGLADASTILAALDEAADVKRDRTANCANGVDRSCGTCQYWPCSVRLHDSAGACLLAAAQPRRPASPDHRPAPDGSPHIYEQDQAQPDSEAGR